jgi:predicted ATP-dependent serine protease
VADAPWRCSQCGTVNEPAANACRVCGRWPSLFDLERDAVETESALLDEADRLETALVPEFDVPVAEDAAAPEAASAPDAERPARSWTRRLGSLIVPIAIVLYIVISAIANR